MAKLLLISVIFALVAIPAWAASHPNPTKAIRWLFVGIVGFNVFYVLALRFIYHRVL